MWYRYEMHLHSSDCSACGRSSAVEMAQALREKGYAGMVLTDHFLRGNSCVPREWSWADKIMAYHEAYRSAREWGNGNDFDVLFGMEHHYGNSKEWLVYGVDAAFWLAHPDIDWAKPDEFARAVHEAGGLIVQAHPFRVREWMSNPVMTFYPELLDGVEVYNYCNTPEENTQALEWARTLSPELVWTSGSDAHWAFHESLGQAGMEFPERVRTGAQLVAALKGECRRVVSGEPVGREDRK